MRPTANQREKIIRRKTKRNGVREQSERGRARRKGESQEEQTTISRPRRNGERHQQHRQKPDQTQQPASLKPRITTSTPVAAASHHRPAAAAAAAAAAAHHSNLPAAAREARPRGSAPQQSEQQRRGVLGWRSLPATTPASSPPPRPGGRARVRQPRYCNAFLAVVFVCARVGCVIGGQEGEGHLVIVGERAAYQRGIGGRLQYSLDIFL